MSKHTEMQGRFTAFLNKTTGFYLFHTKQTGTGLKEQDLKYLFLGGFDKAGNAFDVSLAAFKRTKPSHFDGVVTPFFARYVFMYYAGRLYRYAIYEPVVCDQVAAESENNIHPVPVAHNIYHRTIHFWESAPDLEGSPIFSL